MNSVLIIGCGDTGRRVAALSRPKPVVGIVRSNESVACLAAQQIEAHRLDLDAEIELNSFPATGCEVYYFAPPPPVGDQDPRVERVCSVFRDGNLPAKVVYISTTAVYGDCGGAWIDESAPLRPITARGRRRADAERRLFLWGERTAIPVVVLRVPGIYGPDRLPLERLRKGLPVLEKSVSPYSNRIHIDDLARICVAGMRFGKAGEVYNVSDGHPSTMTDYFNAIADKFGLARPPMLARRDAEQQFSAPMLSYLNESKRILNAKMLDELKIKLDYPDLKTGLESC